MSRLEWVILGVIGILLFVVGMLGGLIVHRRAVTRERGDAGALVAHVPAEGAASGDVATKGGVATSSPVASAPALAARGPAIATSDEAPATAPAVLAASEPASAPAVAASPAATSPALLGYRWKVGEVLGYNVTCDEQNGETSEHREADCFFEVKFIDAETGRVTLNVFSIAVQGRGGRAGRRGMMNMGSPRVLMATMKPHILEVDGTGHVVGTTGAGQIGMGLGSIEERLIQPLPASDGTMDDGVTITQQNRRMTGLFENQMEPAFNYTGRAVGRYTVGSATKGVVRLQVDGRLATLESNGDGPLFQENDRGQIVFDSEVGAIKAVDMTCEVRASRNNMSVHVPVTIHAELLPEETTRALMLQHEAALAAAAEAARPKPIDDEELTGLIARLKTETDTWKLQAICQRLALSIPINGRKMQVGPALDPLLKNKDTFVATGAAKALAVWATRADVKALTEASGGENPFLRSDAMKALAGTHDPLAAGVLAGRLVDFGTRGDASTALKAMGPVAEDAVLAHINNKDDGVATECCRILAVIGTEKSMPALKALRGMDRGFLGETAAAAIGTIEERRVAKRIVGSGGGK